MERFFHEVKNDILSENMIDDPQDWIWAKNDKDVYKPIRKVIRSTKNETQYNLQQEVLEKTSINIVTCGDCGSTLLHRISDDEIHCPDCNFEGEHCDFPDLNYEKSLVG